MFNISKIQIPLTCIIGDAKIMLLDVNPIYEYDSNNKKTEKILGYRYTVVEDSNFDKFGVKIEQTTPSITKEQLDSAKSRIFVKFEDAFGKLYQSQYGAYDISVSAKAIAIDRAGATTTATTS